MTSCFKCRTCSSEKLWCQFMYPLGRLLLKHKGILTVLLWRQEYPVSLPVSPSESLWSNYMEFKKVADEEEEEEAGSLLESWRWTRDSHDWVPVMDTLWVKGIRVCQSLHFTNGSSLCRRDTLRIQWKTSDVWVTASCSLRLVIITTIIIISICFQSSCLQTKRL